jgi:hypothetical protein
MVYKVKEILNQFSSKSFRREPKDTLLNQKVKVQFTYFRINGLDKCWKFDMMSLCFGEKCREEGGPRILAGCCVVVLQERRRRH